MRACTRRTLSIIWPVVVVLLLLPAGCRRKVTEKPLTPEEANLQKFGRLCMEYRKSEGRPAQKAEDVKEWAKRQKGETLKRLEIDDLNKVFVSPRDNEPYTVVFQPMGMGPVLAHEKSGVGGKRLVLNSQGSVFEANEKQFQDMLKSNPARKN